MTSTSTCLRFTNSSGNTISDVDLGVTNTGFVPGGPGVLIGVGIGRAVHRVDKSSVHVPVP